MTTPESFCAGRCSHDTLDGRCPTHRLPVYGEDGNWRCDCPGFEQTPAA